MKLTIDISSVLWSGLLAGTDPEAIPCFESPGVPLLDSKGRPVTVPTCAYGYEKTINSIVKALDEFNLAPKDLLMVFEGVGNTSQRKMINKDYKANRGKRSPEAYQEFTKLSDQLKSTFRNLGACAVTQDYVEADDVIAFLAQESEEELVIMTNDSDLIALRGVNAYGTTIQVRCSGSLTYNKYGISPELIVVYKSLIGDDSDNIKGVPGFGEAAFKVFLSEYGEPGLAELKRLALLGDLSELVDEDSKVVKRILDREKEFLNSFKLASLRPEDIDTMRTSLVWEPGLVMGKCEDERLKKWGAKQYLVTSDKWEGFVNWAAPLIANSEYVALDIETSSAEESDAWLTHNGQTVDTMGSELSGMSLTFGSNMQHTVYISIGHKDTANCDVSKLSKFIMNLGKELVIHNTNFEGVVLYNTWGSEYLDNGYEGFLPKMLDTKFEASYVNENESLGLKKLAKMYFGYGQVEYKAVTTLAAPVGTWEGAEQFEREITPAVLSQVDETFEREDGTVEVTPAGSVLVPAVTETLERKQFKMRDLTAKHVQSYACDDTIVTASLHNHFKFKMLLEHTYSTYLEVEIDAAYLHCQSFVNGTRVDMGRLAELSAEDKLTKDAAEVNLHGYLIEKGWDGSLAPVYTELTAANVKEAVLLSTGQTLKTMIRKLDKLAEMIEDPLLRALVAANDAAGVTEFVKRRFKAKPVFNSGSPLQVSKLLYEVMGAQVEVRNPLTAKAKERGEKVGTPATGELALQYALRDAAPEEKSAIENLKLIKMVQIREGLYYNTYPDFVHWKTGKVHSSHNQASTNTRRASSSAPNLQQLPKHAKIEGQPPKFREVIIPHKRKALIVSMDFAAQELRVIADYSKDTNMLACFIGDNLRDMHALTGLGILQNTEPHWTYETFSEALHNPNHADHKKVKLCRTLGKKVNFTTEFGAKAKKLAATMLIREDEAQVFIDAKEAAFPEAVTWKEQVIGECKSTGKVRSKKGALRHLRDLLNSSDSYTASKAERQSVNYLVQGSSAEMTKLAEGRAWKARLEQRYDAHIIGVIHDELVASCTVQDLIPFCKELHACMVAPYADMFVPIVSSISIGKNFGSQIEVGNFVDEALIQEALLELGF